MRWFAEGLFWIVVLTYLALFSCSVESMNDDGTPKHTLAGAIYRYIERH